MEKGTIILGVAMTNGAVVVGQLDLDSTDDLVMLIGAASLGIETSGENNDEASVTVNEILPRMYNPIGILNIPMANVQMTFSVDIVTRDLYIDWEGRIQEAIKAELLEQADSVE